MGLMVQESFVNVTKGYRYGESDPQEAFTDDVGKLYRFLVREYGRCTGKVYTDTKEGPKAIGWVFVKRVPYDDARSSWKEEDRTYLREVWVTLFDKYEKKTVIEAEHHVIGGSL